MFRRLVRRAGALRGGVPGEPGLGAARYWGGGAVGRRVVRAVVARPLAALVALSTTSPSDEMARTRATCTSVRRVSVAVVEYANCIDWPLAGPHSKAHT